MIQLVIVSGAYGAGKSSAAQAFEEGGFFVTDHIPVGVVDAYFNELVKNEEKYPKVALTVDLENAKDTFLLAKKHPELSIIFLGITCDAQTLNERYRLSRKLHPKEAKGISLEEAIKSDLEYIRKLTDYFDILLDTSNMTKKSFRDKIFEGIIGIEKKFTVSFFSFGYKVSVPQDIETVFDVRLLPNPYWVPELREKTGLDQEVKDYVLNAPETKEYLKHVIAYLDFYLEELRKNDRKHASIGIACSGGQHRSVAIAEYLKNYYSHKYFTFVTHKNL